MLNTIVLSCKVYANPKFSEFLPSVIVRYIYCGSSMLPQTGHLLESSCCCHRSMIGFSWVPRSVQWNVSSRIIVGRPWLPLLQYQRKRSIAPFGRLRSITMPTVSAYLMGECGWWISSVKEKEFLPIHGWSYYVGWEQKCITFFDNYVAKGIVNVDYAKTHWSFLLVKPFLG